MGSDLLHRARGDNRRAHRGLTRMETWVINEIAAAPDGLYEGHSFVAGPSVYSEFSPTSSRSRTKAVSALVRRGFLEKLPASEECDNRLRVTDLAVRKFKLVRGAAAPVAPREVKMWRTRAARSQETAHDE